MGHEDPGGPLRDWLICYIFYPEAEALIRGRQITLPGTGPTTAPSSP